MGSGSSAQKSGGQVEFYWDYRSPPSRCVHMTLMALGEKFVEKPIDLFKGEHKQEDYLKINPAGKVPAVKVGNFTMSESRAIACFLCNKYNTAAAKNLYPRSPQARAEIDRLLLLSDDVFGAINKQINMFNVLFTGGKPAPECLDEAAKGIGMVSAYLKNNNWIAGNCMTIADFFLVTPFILYETLTKDEHQKEFYSHEGGDAVKSWVERIRKLPYFDSINTKGLEGIKEIYMSKL